MRTDLCAYLSQIYAQIYAPTPSPLAARLPLPSLEQLPSPPSPSRAGASACFSLTYLACCSRLAPSMRMRTRLMRTSFPFMRMRTRAGPVHGAVGSHTRRGDDARPALPHLAARLLPGPPRGPEQNLPMQLRTRRRAAAAPPRRRHASPLRRCSAAHCVRGSRWGRCPPLLPPASTGKHRGGGAAVLHDRRPVLRLFPLMHALLARRDRVVPLPPCRLYIARPHEEPHHSGRA